MRIAFYTYNFNIIKMKYNIKVKAMGNQQNPKSLLFELTKIKDQHESLKFDGESILSFDGVYDIVHALYLSNYLTEFQYISVLKKLTANIEDHLNELNKDFKHKIEIVI